MAVKNEKIHINLPQKIDENYIDFGELGRYCKNNKLNELTGKQWIKFTKSWFILRPQRRLGNELLHPAKFPESLVERYIKFFTKEGEKVLDPMAGTGTVNFVCEKIERYGYAIELEEKYYNIGKARSNQSLFLGDCRNIQEFNIPKVDFIITSPPYWDSLKRNHIRQLKRKKRGLDTEYSSNEKNLENIEDYNNFLNELIDIYKNLKLWLKKKKYLVVVVNNIYKDGRLYPLAFDLASKLGNYYTLKDEQVWCQDDKRLVALGINNAYVGNRHHVYCLIFRKEDKSMKTK